MPYVALVAMILGTVAIFWPAVLGRPGVFASLAIVMVATMLALVVRWSSLPHYAVAVIPLMDILAIPFLRHALGDLRVGDLVIIPVVWMSAQWFLRGVAVSAAAATLVIWSSVPFGQSPLDEPSRFFLGPAVVTIVGVAIALISRRGGATQAMLEQQSRLTEAALDRANRQQLMLDGILNAMPIGVVGLDQNGQPTIVNRRQRRLLGPDADVKATADQDLDLDLWDSDRSRLIGPSDDPLVRARRGETFDHLLVWTYGAANGGEMSALDVSARQITNEYGEPAGAVLAYLDVTREVEALRAREDLIAAVSHELRTPLTSIVGYLELLYDSEELTEQTRQMVRIASSNADRLLKIVSDLLVAAREADAVLPVAPETIDLVPLIHDSVRLISPRADDARIDVVADLPAALEVRVDGARLRQVIDNVLSNAVKYGKPSGHVWLSLSRTSGQAGNGTWPPPPMILLTIADDGIGISSEGQSKLFDRFYRAESTRRTAVHGAGLGLHISRTIMRQHGGDITISSVTDVGTTVRITLPEQMTTLPEYRPVDEPSLVPEPEIEPDHAS